MTSEAATVKLVLLGPSGSGKSATANLLAKHLGVAQPPFEECADAKSSAAPPTTCLAADMGITDTLGLLDSNGEAKDNANIRANVDVCIGLGAVNAFLLPMNEECRFDAGTQDAVKLVIDSLGSGEYKRQILSHMGIIFTRARGARSRESAMARAREISQMLSDRTGLPFVELPCWQVDCHPEHLAQIGLPPEGIGEAKQRTQAEVEALLQWVRTRPAMPTSEAVAAQYDHARRLEEERQARERDNAVVAVHMETRTRETGTTTTPIYRTEQHEGRRRGLFGHRHVHTVTVHVGNTVVRHMVEEQREARTLGSGRVDYGEWVATATPTSEAVAQYDHTRRLEAVSKVAQPIQLCVIGRTGDGKSALCSLIAKHLGAAHTPFQAADSANSHTRAPVSSLVSDINITDTPGLMDSMGAARDAENIRGIVNYARSLNVIHAFLLVVNEQAPRFDSGMVEAVELLAKSFGTPIFDRMCIVFTHSFGFRSPEKAEEKTREICSMFEGNVVPPSLKCWQVDCHPENLIMLGVPEERVASMKSATSTAVEGILSWARSCDPMPMDQAVAAQYDHVRLLEEEKKARERDNAVVSTFTESRTRELGTTSTPIMATENHRQRVAFMRIGNLGTSRVSRTVQVGTHVVRHMAEEQREGQALGSGRVLYGEWQEIRRWDE